MEGNFGIDMLHELRQTAKKMKRHNNIVLAIVSVALALQIAGLIIRADKEKDWKKQIMEIAKRRAERPS